MSSNSSNTIPVDLYREKLHVLLGKLEKRQITKDEARELKPLLEKEMNEALKESDTKPRYYAVSFTNRS